MEDDPTNKRKTVGTHTSYMSCCLFPNSDQQVSKQTLVFLQLRIIYILQIVDIDWKWGLHMCTLGRRVGAASTEFPRT